MYVGVTYNISHVPMSYMIPEGDSESCEVWICSCGIDVSGGGVDMGITGPEHGFPGSWCSGLPVLGPHNPDTRAWDPCCPHPPQAP